MLSSVFCMPRGRAGADSVSRQHRLPLSNALARMLATAGCASAAKNLHTSCHTSFVGCTHPVCDCSDRTVRAKSTSTSPGLGPTILLRVFPSLDKPGHKLVVSSGNSVEFHLVKCQGLQQHDQYQWQLKDENVDSNGRLSISYEGKGDGVQVCDQAGALVSAIDLSRGAYYTVIKFSWSSKTYRWVMIRKDAGNSPSQLCFSLFEGSSKQSLASFHGPGFQQKQFWVQQSQHDVLSVQQTDDPAWLQVVVATCMVAAKTQRHKDKVTDRSRR